MSKPRVRILLPAWGSHYVELATEFCVPALLSPGNIPALAQLADCTFVFLTREADVEGIRQTPCYRELRAHCAATFSSIDDLVVPGLPDLTLTYAFARGLHETGADMTSIRFVFVNADFVFSDGALQIVADNLHAEGAAAIMAPSLRCVAEDVTPALRRARNGDRLSLSARQLVRIALDHLHPTAVASIVNQPWAYNTAANQFFWRIDDDALLGRFYLLFMLSIKPQRGMTGVPGFCDYTFVPAMCPSGQVAVIEDSDLGFVMELQQRSSELPQLRIGRPSIGAIAADLSSWATELHRQNATHTVLFHASGIPSGFQAMSDEAESFIGRITKCIASHPLGYDQNTYWSSLTAAAPYAHRQTLQPPQSIERGPVDAHLPLPRRAARFLFRRTLGVPPYVTVLHHDWLDFRNLQPTLRRFVSNPDARLLVVTDNFRFHCGMQTRWNERADHLVPAQLLSAPAPSEKYDLVVAYLDQRHLGVLRDLVSGGAQMVRPNGEMIVMIHEPIPTATGIPLARLVFTHLSTLASGIGVEEIVTTEGPARRFLKRRCLEALTRIYKNGVMTEIGAIAMLAPLLGAILLTNLTAVMRRQVGGRTATCSSVLFRVPGRLRGPEPRRDRTLVGHD